jgi:hypothetical protein
MNLTIIKFQELYTISQSNLNETDMATRLIQCFTRKTEQEIDKMKLSDFNKLCQKVQQLFVLPESKPYPYLKAGKNWYKVNFDIGKMKAGRYVEVTVFSNDVIGNLHKIMASICTPVKLTLFGFKELPYQSSKHEDYANDMLSAPFYKSYQSMLFFSVLYRELIRNTQPYLEKQMIAKGVDSRTAAKTMEDLLKILDGYIQPKWLKNLKVEL